MGSFNETAIRKTTELQNCDINSLLRFSMQFVLKTRRQCELWKMLHMNLSEYHKMCQQVIILLFVHLVHQLIL